MEKHITSPSLQSYQANMTILLLQPSILCIYCHSVQQGLVAIHQHPSILKIALRALLATILSVLLGPHLVFQEQAVQRVFLDGCETTREQEANERKAALHTKAIERQSDAPKGNLEHTARNDTCWSQLSFYCCFNCCC